MPSFKNMNPRHLLVKMLQDFTAGNVKNILQTLKWKLMKFCTKLVVEFLDI